MFTFIIKQFRLAILLHIAINIAVNNVKGRSFTSHEKLHALIRNQHPANNYNHKLSLNISHIQPDSTLLMDNLYINYHYNYVNNDNDNGSNDYLYYFGNNRETPKPKAKLKSDYSPRVTLKGSSFIVNGKKVNLQGPNYLLKGRPYFPDINTVKQDARDISAALNGVPGVRPMIRLGTLMEGYMPTKDVVSEEWMKTLENVIMEFNKAGVYIILDVHSDALVSTNCGQGFPAWMAKYMQENDNTHGYPYYISRSQPLELANSFWGFILKMVGGVQSIRVMDDDSDPWFNFSFADKENGENPAQFQNIGNQNCRLNNMDSAWSQGTILFTKQIQNFANRLYSLGSTSNKKDIENLYTPYANFIKYLGSLWESHSNVVAIELLNEPIIAGFPNPFTITGMRKKLFDFYAKIINDLDREHLNVPIAFEDLGGSLPGAGWLWSLLGNWLLGGSVSLNAMETLHRKAGKNQLIIAFHFYETVLTSVTFEKMAGEIAIQQAQKYHPEEGQSIPVYLSEFFSNQRNSAIDMINGTTMGVGACTYWHYKNFYSPQNLIVENIINKTIWPEYVQDVANGKSFGAEINGAAGGDPYVLWTVRKIVCAEKQC